MARALITHLIPFKITHLKIFVPNFDVPQEIFKTDAVGKDLWFHIQSLIINMSDLVKLRHRNNVLNFFFENSFLKNAFSKYVETYIQVPQLLAEKIFRPLCIHIFHAILRPKST